MNICIYFCVWVYESGCSSCSCEFMQSIQYWSTGINRNEEIQENSQNYTSRIISDIRHSCRATPQKGQSVQCTFVIYLKSVINAFYIRWMNTDLDFWFVILGKYLKVGVEYRKELGWREVQEGKCSGLRSFFNHRPMKLAKVSEITAALTDRLCAQITSLLSWQHCIMNNAGIMCRQLLLLKGTYPICYSYIVMVLDVC